MGQIARGPRLYLKKGAGRRAMWFIRHGTRMHSTGFAEGDRSAAEEVFDAYCVGGRFKADRGEPGHFTSPDTIYFVTCDHPDFPIKIGITSDVAARIRALKVALPYGVVLLASVPGDLDQEQLWHVQFAEQRLQGEWFSRSDRLMDAIKLRARQEHERRKIIKELTS